MYVRERGDRVTDEEKLWDYIEQLQEVHRAGNAEEIASYVRDLDTVFADEESEG